MKPESFVIMHCINRARERYGIEDFTEADWVSLGQAIKRKSETATLIKKCSNGSQIWLVQHRGQDVLCAYMKKRGVLSLLPKEDGRLAAYDKQNVRDNAKHIANCYRQKLDSIDNRIARARAHLEELLLGAPIVQTRQQIEQLMANRESLLSEISAFEDVNSMAVTK